MLFKKHSGAERETGRRRDRPQSGALLQRARQQHRGDDQKRRMETCALTNKHPMNERWDPDENYHMIPVCFHVSVHLVSAFRDISEAKKCFGTNYRHLITTFHSFTSQMNVMRRSRVLPKKLSFTPDRETLQPFDCRIFDIFWWKWEYFIVQQVKVWSLSKVTAHLISLMKVTNSQKFGEGKILWKKSLLLTRDAFIWSKIQ